MDLLKSLFSRVGNIFQPQAQSEELSNADRARMITDRMVVNNKLPPQGNSTQNIPNNPTTSSGQFELENRPEYVDGNLQQAVLERASKPQNDSNFRFAYETMPRDSYFAQNGARPNFNPQQPPPDIANLLRKYFPNDATRSATLAVTENSQFDPDRPDAINYDDSGRELSRDRGLFQINDKTFGGEMGRYGDVLKGQGIDSYDDMYDAEKNAIFAKHLLDKYGAGRWFGWQDTGYDLNNGYFSAPLRGQYAENKKRMSPEQALRIAREQLQRRK